MDSSLHREPQRLSALYQYHNAPEVAPAHGLEYDDTVYPSSDKYPVLTERYFDPKRDNNGFASDNRPPRIIFGMKIKTFLVVALIMILIVVGAAVGGAVGGQQLRANQEGQFATTPTYSSQTTSTSTFSAATPTYTPLSDCPASNNTTYTSSFAQVTPQASNAGLRFTKYCDLSDPLASASEPTSGSRSSSGVAQTAEAFVYSFSDCVELCASSNYFNNDANCTVAVYQPDAARPGNCWVGYTDKGLVATSLAPSQGTDVAILLPQSS